MKYRHIIIKEKDFDKIFYLINKASESIIYGELDKFDKICLKLVDKIKHDIATARGINYDKKIERVIWRNKVKK